MILVKKVAVLFLTMSSVLMMVSLIVRPSYMDFIPFSTYLILFLISVMVFSYSIGYFLTDKKN